ncbi:hypothetical protein JTB14_029722 [Gonioctena quinquepunctata]|nr:hypothetical protein JTB14_029722 [Gonioctena quinquepunctata]
MEAMAGVPQESVLISTLWNIQNDGVLRIKLTEGAETIRFAIIVKAKDDTKLTSRTNRTIRQLNKWMGENELTLAPQKPCDNDKGKTTYNIYSRRLKNNTKQNDKILRSTP